MEHAFNVQRKQCFSKTDAFISINIVRKLTKMGIV